MRAVLFLAMTGIAMAQDYTWQVESSVTYQTGSYGSDQNTRFFYWPVTVKRFLRKGDVSLTVPYSDITTDGGVTVVDGAVLEGAGSGGSGLGDISIKGRYNWMEQSGRLPFIDLIVRLKLPTANEGKGLGTGEADMGLGVELVRHFENNYIGFSDLTYTMIGDPEGVNYRNRLDADVGVGNQFTPKLLGCVSYDYRSAISDSSSDSHSLTFLANYKVVPQVKTYGMLEVGLSDGAPDFGITVGASYRF